MIETLTSSASVNEEGGFFLGGVNNRTVLASNHQQHPYHQPQSSGKGEAICIGTSSTFPKPVADQNVEELSSSSSFMQIHVKKEMFQNYENNENLRENKN